MVNGWLYPRLRAVLYVQIFQTLRSLLKQTRLWMVQYTTLTKPNLRLLMTDRKEILGLVLIGGFNRRLTLTMRTYQLELYHVWAAVESNPHQLRRLRNSHYTMPAVQIHLTHQNPSSFKMVRRRIEPSALTDRQSVPWPLGNPPR